ncbi:hypothetical protein AS026_05290 [Rhizobium altiplani]|uniref:Uncharacterized protein n=1 Tax=Rhizobium altiplani TaxID=1864509 RepID=A0A109JMY5_9HYPH|nr:hypothetical protein AS026_05290 [Rhizobium altiplani]
MSGSTVAKILKHGIEKRADNAGRIPACIVVTRDGFRCDEATVQLDLRTSSLHQDGSTLEEPTKEGTAPLVVPIYTSDLFEGRDVGAGWQHVPW